MRLFRAIAAAVCVAAFSAAAAVAQTMDPFHWLEGSTVSITTANSSANVALAKMPTGTTQLRLVSNCTTLMFMRKGANSSVTAAATDIPIAPGEVEVLTVENAPSAPITYMAMISPSGSCTLYITTGQGI